MIMTLACQFQHLLAKPVKISNSGAVCQRKAHVVNEVANEGSTPSRSTNLPASGIDRTQPRANVATVAEAGVRGATGKDSRPNGLPCAVAALRGAVLDCPNTPAGSKSDVSRFDSGRTFHALADRDTAGNTLPASVPASADDSRRDGGDRLSSGAREGTLPNCAEINPVQQHRTLRGGQFICAGGGVEADTPGEREATTCVSASGKGEAARRPESALDQSSGTNAGNIVRMAEIVASRGSVLPARTNLARSAVQLPESEYLETICDAIELADSPDEFRVIRAAIARVRGAVNRSSLRMMVQLREKELAL